MCQNWFVSSTLAVAILLAPGGRFLLDRAPKPHVIKIAPLIPLLEAEPYFSRLCFHALERRAHPGLHVHTRKRLFRMAAATVKAVGWSLPGSISSWKRFRRERCRRCTRSLARLPRGPIPWAGAIVHRWDVSSIDRQRKRNAKGNVGGEGRRSQEKVRWGKRRITQKAAIPVHRVPRCNNSVLSQQGGKNEMNDMALGKHLVNIS